VYYDISDAAGNSRIVTTINNASVYAPSIHNFVQYDRFGRRTQEGTIGGRITTFTHDLSGRVITEQSLGVNNTFTHNIFGVTSIRNIEGNTRHNTYDSMGRLVTSSDFMGSTQRFTYDALGRLLRHYVPFDRVGAATRYATTLYFYDRNGNLNQTHSSTNLPGSAAAWSVTNNTFRHNLLMLSQTGNGPLTEYTYDLAGNVLTKRVGGVGGATTAFTYNNRGQLVQTTDALNQTETFTYDVNGLPLTRTDRNGTLFRMTYNYIGLLIREEAVQNGVVVGHRRYIFRRTGALASVSNGTHLITNAYDAQGRLIRQTETGGIERTFVYNEADNIIESRVYINGRRYTHNVYAYDVAQRVRTVTSNGQLHATYAYNANGNRVRTTLSNGVITDYTHNLSGLVTSLVNRQGNATLSRFDYTYYLDGNMQRVTEMMGGTTRTVTYAYDTARRLIREHDTGAGGGAITRTYTFDARGNRTQMVVAGAEAYAVTYVYDLNNRMLTETRTGRNPSIATLTYDRNGNQLSRVATSGPSSTRPPRPIEGLGGAIRVIFEGVEQVSVRAFGTSNTLIEIDHTFYTEVWRAGNRTVLKVGDSAYTTTDNGKRLYYTFCSLWPIGAFSFNNMVPSGGEPVRITAKYISRGQYLWKSEYTFYLDNVAESPWLFVDCCEPYLSWNNNMFSMFMEAMEMGIALEMEFDSLAELVEQLDSLDILNERTAMEGMHALYVTDGLIRPMVTSDDVYAMLSTIRDHPLADGTNRLGGAIRAANDATYDTDSLQAEMRTDSRQSVAMVTTAQGEKQTETRTYNAFNQLVRFEENDAVSTYVYRPDGLRLSKTVNGVRTTHVWCMGNIVLEQNANGGVKNRFVRGARGQLVRSEHHGWYLFNVRGDVVQRVDNAGNMLHAYRYTAFGNELNPVASDTNRFRFAGEYWDAHRGEYYLRARSFNPRTGRFTTPDPWWGLHNMQFGTNPVTRNGRLMPNQWAIMQAGNLFVFGVNNPVRWTDPLGLWTKDIHEELTRLALELIGADTGMEDLFASFMDSIVAGNRGVDYPPYRALRWWSESAQSRHFNRNSANATDSRLVWAEHYLTAAINLWLMADMLSVDNWFTAQDRLDMQMNALYLLGRGLHSIQDIEAHGNIGMGLRGALFAAHVDPRTDSRYYDWSSSSRRWVTSSTEQARFSTSLNDSVDFLNRFFTAIGLN